jgi:hypothetical protein
MSKCSHALLLLLLQHNKGVKRHHLLLWLMPTAGARGGGTREASR